MPSALPPSPAEARHLALTALLQAFIHTPITPNQVCDTDVLARHGSEAQEARWELARHAVAA